MSIFGQNVLVVHNLLISRSFLANRINSISQLAFKRTLHLIMSVSRAEILRLYKNLMLYSKSLTLTDPAYFRQRISTEFKQKKSLTKPKDILFAYQKGEALLRRGAVV